MRFSTKQDRRRDSFRGTSGVFGKFHCCIGDAHAGHDSGRCHFWSMWLWPRRAALFKAINLPFHIGP